MKSVERNYGYGIGRSRAADLGNVELTVYRFGQEIGLDGVARNQKSAIATFEAPIAPAERDVSTIMPGLSAAVARVELGSFLAQNPDSKAVYDDGLGRLHDEADAEIADAEREAYKMEERRVAVALAVAGMDLHTADEMASIEAAQLAAKQTFPIEG